MDWNRLLCTKRIRELFGGRASTPVAEDDRSEFDRDYDRTVFSTPVRRLQDKTQVFPLEPNDAVRTRLTHSLEVSTLARGLAGGAARWLLKEGHLQNDQQALDLESIAATCGLIHDLGNPPFGHAGEQAISSWFEQKSKADKNFFSGLRARSSSAAQLRNDFLKFEGNAQTLRIVTRLQLLVDQHGLNMTVGTLSAAMKYTAASHEVTGDEGPHEKEKPGYFASERDIVEKVREHAGTGAARNPIAYLVEACDDIVYATVDIEDGVKKGIVSWEEIEQALKQAADSDSKPLVEDQTRRARKYIDDADSGLRGRARDEAIAQHFRTVVIGTAKIAVLRAFESHYDAIIHGEPFKTGELIKASTAAGLIKACKTVGREHIYNSDETLRLEAMGRRIIHELMDIFWEGASASPSKDPKAFGRSFEGKIYNLLSRNYRTVFEAAIRHSTLPPRYHQFQLVTDYVCGMTDTFACKLHAQLTHG